MFRLLYMYLEKVVTSRSFLRYKCILGAKGEYLHRMRTV